MDNLTLPELPDNMFWRLRSDGWGYMWVELRVKRRWFGSKQMEHGMVLANPPVDEAIKDATEWVLKRYEKRNESIAFLNEFREHEGDYS
jgi:hypothetical protein